MLGCGLEGKTIYFTEHSVQKLLIALNINISPVKLQKEIIQHFSWFLYRIKTLVTVCYGMTMQCNFLL